MHHVLVQEAEHGFLSSQEIKAINQPLILTELLKLIPGNTWRSLTTCFRTDIILPQLSILQRASFQPWLFTTTRSGSKIQPPAASVFPFLFKRDTAGRKSYFQEWALKEDSRQRTQKVQLLHIAVYFGQAQQSEFIFSSHRSILP